jgi:hypothetical protein
MKHDWWIDIGIKLMKRYNYRKELSLKQTEEVYDALYYLADLMLKKHNPCAIKLLKSKKGKRTRHSVICIAEGGYTCCRSCHYLGINGCKVKCLACKLFLCSYFTNKKYDIIQGGIGSLRIFRMIMDNFNTGYYRSKKDAFRNIRQKIVDEKKLQKAGTPIHIL